MDGVSSAVSSAVNQSQETQAVGLEVLKKAMLVQAQGAMALIQSLPQYNNPAHLGGSVDIKV